jgi:pyrimidine-nucleoside phosphorylase
MKMNQQDLIRKKRDGESFSPAEIEAFVCGVTDGRWADYQSSALLMAMFINGLNLSEQNALTQSMLGSGETLDFSDIDAPKADKHSTGGVGDKTSLVLAPLAAACGVAVPMISGRGLGHTGGTLDKLEAIPGYRVNLSLAEFRRVIKTCGFSMIGQTKEIVPADKKLYALRDATSTVESIPLIVASIMSKKLAEGLGALILDVKTGSGAFMQELEQSKKLAAALCTTGNACRVRTEAIISDMNQPLGKFVGNALEVFECIKILRGESDREMAPTLDLSVELTARMLVLTSVAENLEKARKMCAEKLGDGSALEKFRQNIELQDGNPDACDKPDLLIGAGMHEARITAANSGFVTEIDALAIGRSISMIGGGRMRVEDKIDFSVGYQCEKKIGDEVKAGETLGILFCRTENQAGSILRTLQGAYSIGEEKPRELELVKEVVS